MNGPPRAKDSSDSPSAPEEIVRLDALSLSLRSRSTLHEHESDRAALFTVLFSGEYDPLLASLRPKDVVLDAGANAGYFTVLASRIVGGAGRVIAVEPDPRNASVLRRNVDLNRCSNVIIYERALSDGRRARVRMAGSGVQAHVSDAGELDVGADTLDSICAEAGVERLDHLKMDIEGSEIAVLGDSNPPRCLSGLRAAAVEVHSRLAERTVRASLTSLGMVVSEVRHEWDNRVTLAANVGAHPVLTLRLYGTDLLRVASRLCLPRVSRRRWYARPDNFLVGTVFARRKGAPPHFQ